MSDKIIVTHAGKFHTDDVLAVAVLTLICDKRGDTYEIVRSRKSPDWERGDYVVDVGGIYDAKTNRFDHHQEGRAGARANGIFYSSLGLVWQAYGEELCGSKEIASKLDEKLVQPIDAIDNGQSLDKSLFEGVRNYTVGDVVDIFLPTWQEASEENFYQGFLQAVEFGRSVLVGELRQNKSVIDAREEVQKLIIEASDKRLLVSDKYFPIEGDIFEANPQILFVIMPDVSGGWRLKTVRKGKDTFEARKDLPSAWAGKRDQELQELTAVSDATFCHNALFIAGAVSKEGAVALAKLALLD